VAKTEVIENDASPRWSQEFTLQVPRGEHTVTLEVKNAEQGQELGHISVNFHNRPGERVTVEEKLRSGHKDAAGQPGSLAFEYFFDTSILEYAVWKSGETKILQTQSVGGFLRGSIFHK